MPRLSLNIAPRLSQLSLLSKVLLAHGLFDALLPNPTTAPPLWRAFDRQHRSKKKRGWAWLFLMCGLMKVQSAFTDAPAAACIAGWAYAAQAVAVTMEGFFHGSIPRAEKVLMSTIGFNIAMWAWLQFTAWHDVRRRVLAVQATLVPPPMAGAAPAERAQAAVAGVPKPSAPPRTPRKEEEEQQQRPVDAAVRK
mmetsp:Transcript_16569/g.34995  ORF Transcript_16569/g.34995 Transcript_16569/m.34995 type:complete len:194 (-) Transcript_16569:57-638(-)